MRAPWGRAALVAALALIVIIGRPLLAAELPPKPDRYFNDYAALVSSSDGDRLDARLRAFDEETGHQLIVAIFRELPPNAAIEDFTVRTAQAWGVGRSKEDDGAVLFVFAQNRRSRLEVGYGLEDRLPDLIARRVVQEVIPPFFREQRYADGLSAAIDMMIAETRTPGSTAPPPRVRSGQEPGTVGSLVALGIFIVFVILASRAQRGRGGRGGGGWYSGGGFSGGGWSSGGWSGGGGGGFSGGGGSFGGGGASGDW